MTFTYSKEFSLTGFTEVENSFIVEYMPEASGDAVRVYLYGLYLCKSNQADKSLSDFALTLNLSETEVKDIFLFWEEFGLVSVLSDQPFEVQYLPVRGIGSSKRKYKAEKYTDFAKGVQSLIPSRMISTNEYTEYFSIMETYSIKPEAMLMIVRYCIGLKGNDISYRYISKVAKDFGARGITTTEKVEEELSAYILRTSEIQKILKAMGLKRNPEVEDLKFLNKWTKELNFETDTIIFSASKIKKGSMEKLDEFLLDLYSMKSFTKEEVKDYMDKKQEVYDLAVKINRALSIYMEVIDTVVDTYTKKWLSFGFSGDALIFIANRCFKNGNNTLQYMDTLVEDLYKRGFVDLTGVSDYFEQIEKDDLFIKKILSTAGINRRPNEWDRQNLATWKSWNFSDEMILSAAGMASGKSSPIPYITGVLSNWKREGIYTLEKGADNSKTDSLEEYNLEYARRRNLAVSRAQSNLERAKELTGFMDIYARLNGIEKDLAFAEIADNQALLSSLEKEKTTLLSDAENMLKSIGLTLKNLEPEYACPKCRDTGYVGTHRCDCFDKKVK